jgi:Restriction endonuclease
MNGREYEVLVQEIFQQLLNQDSVGNVLVEHDVRKKGIVTSHQIDVYWEFSVAGITYRTVVQAKNWAKPVDQGELLKFNAVLSDLPGQPLGIIVTAQGYQEGALEVADAHGIKIYELKQEAKAPSRNFQLNYTGWGRYAIKGYRMASSGQPFGLIMETDIVNPEFSGLNFRANTDSIRDNSDILHSIAELKVHSHELEFYDADYRFLRTLRDIYCDLAKEVAGLGQVSAPRTYSFDAPTFLRLPSTSAFVKVEGFSVEVALKTEHHERLWLLGNVVMFVLNSLDDGKTWRFVRTAQS